MKPSCLARMPTSACELGWYNWVKFHLANVYFPNDLLVLRKYLGPSIAVGTAMTAEIFTLTGKVVHHSTYRSLTPEELADPIKQDHMKAFLWTAEDQ